MSQNTDMGQEASPSGILSCPNGNRKGSYPTYTIRESARAKHVRLRISSRDGSLTIVVPKGFDHRELPGVIEQKRRWIERVQQQVAEQCQSIELEGSDGLPTVVNLRAISEEWRVEYRELRGREVAPERTLIVYGEIENMAGCKQAVCRWLHDKARLHLVSWLAGLSARHNLVVARVAVRSQRTRWGSCSQRNGINLNQKLLFLPPLMAEQVMLHELCHTVHHDHSQRFWGLLRSFSPDTTSLEVELRAAWRYVPAWADR